MKFLAQLTPPLLDMTLPFAKQIEVKFVEREVVEETFVFDSEMNPKWSKRLL